MVFSDDIFRDNVDAVGTRVDEKDEDDEDGLMDKVREVEVCLLRDNNVGGKGWDDGITEDGEDVGGKPQ